MSVDVPQIDGVIVGYGEEDAMCDSWGGDVEWFDEFLEYLVTVGFADERHELR